MFYLKIIIFDKIKDLQEYCAQLFIDQVKQNPFAKIGFATGVSPIDCYKLIIKYSKQNNISWKNVTTFNLDEFVNISKDHKQAFIKQMKDNLFDHLDTDPKNINFLDCQTSDPEKECQRYENLIRSVDGIDFQYISLGINGHMAYNEPNTSFNTDTHVVKLTKETILDMVNKKKFNSLDDCPTHAMTMGIQTLLNWTKKAIMVSYGIHKALVTKQMIEDKPNEQITASFLQLHKDCTYILDKDAASLLDKKYLEIAERR
ncbi:glucosamine-6-phosphate deaminase [Mycoplasma capricolum]|uniref:glucosamine-6-phosphate deaminase n=1 Tax=Mycoplasma capricolum TaxID=2095 RepID=UPI0022F3ACEF|nr:glucosamine-6-phosphate deaminase [Mycoplasma capricolum]WBX35813.1 glucosamine-6-phosphate deaminase [Mycoplasma capricolum subsp. capricolum]